MGRGFSGVMAMCALLLALAGGARAASPVIVPVQPGSSDLWAVASTDVQTNPSVQWLPGLAENPPVRAIAVTPGSHVYLIGDPYVNFRVVWEDVGSGQPTPDVQGSNGYSFPLAGEYPYHCQALSVNVCGLPGKDRRSKVWVIGPRPELSTLVLPAAGGNPARYAFDASASSVTDFAAHSIVEYAYDVTSDGIWDQVGSAPDAQVPLNATDQVTVRVKDDLGRVATIAIGLPQVDLRTPVDGARYRLGQTVMADYSCTDADGPADIASCDGDVPDGAAIDTSTPGEHEFRVDAEDQAGNPGVATVRYVVEADVPAGNPGTNVVTSTAAAATTAPSLPGSVAPNPPATPAPPAGLNAARARSAAAAALLARYGSTWKRGTRRSLRCGRLGAQVYECRARWRRGGRRYERRVVVSLTGTRTRAVIRG